MCYKFKNAYSMSPVMPSASSGMAYIGGFSRCTIHPEHRKSEVSVEGIPYKIYVPIALRISARCAEAGLVLLCH